MALQRRSGSVATFIASARSLTVWVPYGLVVVSGPDFGMTAVSMNVETDQP